MSKPPDEILRILAERGYGPDELRPETIPEPSGRAMEILGRQGWAVPPPPEIVETPLPPPRPIPQEPPSQGVPPEELQAITKMFPAQMPEQLAPQPRTAMPPPRELFQQQPVPLETHMQTMLQQVPDLARVAIENMARQMYGGGPGQVVEGLKQAWQHGILGKPQEEPPSNIGVDVGRGATEAVKALAEFIPKTAIALYQDPVKQITQDPVGTIFLFSLVSSVAGRGLFKTSVDTFFKKAEAAGYPVRVLQQYREAISRVGRPEGLIKEIDRFVKVRQTEIPPPRVSLGRRMAERAEPATLLPAEPQKPVLASKTPSQRAVEPIISAVPTPTPPPAEPGLGAELYVNRTPRQQAQARARFDREAKQVLVGAEQAKTLEAVKHNYADYQMKAEGARAILAKGELRGEPLTADTRTKIEGILGDSEKQIVQIEQKYPDLTKSQQPVKTAEEPQVSAPAKIQKLATTYLNEKINYGGEIKTRGEVIAGLQGRGESRGKIDHFMMGAKAITPETLTEIPEPVPEKPTVPPVEAVSPSSKNPVDEMYRDVVASEKKKREAGAITFGKKVHQQTPLSDPQVQKVVKASHKPLYLRERIRASIKETADDVKRLLVYEHTLKSEPQFKNDMRLFQDVPYDAHADAIKKIIATVGKMTRAEERDFAAWVALKTMLDDVQEGKRVSGNLEERQIEKAISEIEANKTPVMDEALARHKEITKLVADDLIARGKIKEEQVGDLYYPHRVLDYLVSWADWRGLPKRMTRPFRGYTQLRKGTGRLIDFDYIAAMRAYYTNVFMDNAIEDFAEKTLEKFDIKDALSDTDRETLFGQSKEPKPRGTYEIKGKEHQGFQYIRGSQFYPGLTIREDLLQKALAEGWTIQELEKYEGPEGGKAIKKALIVGKKHPVYLVPKVIAERLERLRIPAGDLPLYWKLMKGTQTWKRLTLDFAGLPFQVQNFVGDAINLTKSDPAAFEKVVRSAYVIEKWLYNPKALTPEEQEILKVSGEHRVITTNFFREGGMIPAGIVNAKILDKFKSTAPINFLGELIQQYENLSIGREATLRLAKFMKDLERIADGKQVVARGIDVRGLTPIDAAGKAAREFTVDYGAVPPAYRRFIRGFLTPFMTFYDYNARGWWNYVRKNPGNFLLKYGPPFVLTMLWNNTGERKEIEKRLGFWRFLPHVITGYRTKEGKSIIVGFQTPIEMAAGWVGLDRLPANIEDVIHKKKTIGQAALKQLEDMGLGPARMVVRLFNPMFLTIAGLLQNKDPYTRRQVVPERFKGTKYQKAYVAEFIMSNILTPYGQYLRLRHELEYSPQFGKVAAWFLKGPLDLFRAIGIRKVDLDVQNMIAAYEKREELSGAVKNKLAILEQAFIKANLLPEIESAKYFKGQMATVQAMKGPMPTNEQMVNRLYGFDTTIAILERKIQQAREEEPREALKEMLRQIKEMRFAVSMQKHTLKSVRPELSLELGKIFEKKE